MGISLLDNFNDVPNLLILTLIDVIRLIRLICYFQLLFRHCLDIKDFLAAAIVYETIGEWPQVNVLIKAIYITFYQAIAFCLPPLAQSPEHFI